MLNKCLVIILAVKRVVNIPCRMIQLGQEIKESSKILVLCKGFLRRFSEDRRVKGFPQSRNWNRSFSKKGEYD